MKTASDIAREYFIEKGLQYSDITELCFKELVSILKFRLAQENRARDKANDMDYRFSIDSKFCKYQKAADDKPFQAFIEVTLDNYVSRPAISFNSNGWIGFAGWASSHNVKPFTDAFMEWCDWMASEKLVPCAFCGLALEVNYLPDNPVLGTIVRKEDVEYVFTNDGWKTINTPENKLCQIRNRVREMENSPLKSELLEILTN